VIRRLEITEVDHVQSFMRTYGADGDDDDDDDDDEYGYLSLSAMTRFLSAWAAREILVRAT
jgi:hypothetical protein